MTRSAMDLRLGPLLGGLLFSLLPSAVAVAADATIPAYTEVTVDLEGGLVKQVLPFDVPFVFTGEAPTGVQAIVVRCWQVETCRQVRKQRVKQKALSEERRRLLAERKAFCNDRRATATVPPNVEGAPNGNCPTWPAPPTRGAVAGLPQWIDRVPDDPTPGDPQKKTFNIVVPMLEAEKHYTFQFSWDRTLTQAEADAFAALVATTADEILWSVGSADSSLPASGSLTNDELAAIRRRLVEALLDVAAADRVVDCTDSAVLCPDVPINEVRDEFLGLFHDVRDAQSRLDATLRTYKSEVDQLNVNLRRLQNDAGIAALLRAGDSVAADTPSLDDEMEKFRQVLALEQLPDVRPEHRQSPEALATFATQAGAAARLAAGLVGDLRNFLDTGLVDGDGDPRPALEEMIDAGTLTLQEGRDLEAMATSGGRVGSVHRALERLANQAAELQRLLAERATARDLLAGKFRSRAVVVVLLAGTTLADFKTAQQNYISGDGGLAFALELDEAATYLGTNVYSRPINKSAALSQFGNFWQTLDRRLALTLGMTIDGIGDNETREDLIGSQSLVVGLGARLTGSMRLTAGALVFKKRDPNPLVDDLSLTATPFVSLSFDVDVVPFLTGLGNAFKSQ